MLKTICIFGDSIAWGASDPLGGWAGRLRSEFDGDAQSDAVVYNLGVCGDTSVGLTDRFTVECEARKPQVIVIAIGVNDSALLGENREASVALEEFGVNLYELIETAKLFTMEITLVGLTRVDESKTKPTPWATDWFYDNENISLYDEVIKKVAEVQGVKYEAMNEVLELADLEDGLHPNSQGHEKMYLKIKEYI